MIRNTLKMYLWVNCLCFMWILIQVQAKYKYDDWNFDIMVLGHSGLLISWDNPDGGNYFEKNLYFFSLTYQDISKNYNKTTLDPISVECKQYQIYPLNKTTQYQINVTLYRNESAIEKYQTEGTTGDNITLKPGKPAFEWRIMNDSFRQLGIRILWLPCGQEEECNGNKTGTHFSLKYKLLESKQWFYTGAIHRGYYEMRYIYPGRIYEMVITSVNGHFQTDSDLTEVFIAPASGPVRSGEAKQSLNASFWVSWIQPSQFLYPVIQYNLLFIYSDRSPKITAHIFDTSSIVIYRIAADPMYRLVTTRIHNLNPTLACTIVIIPEMRNSRFGLEYSFDYKPSHQPQSSKTLPTATPDGK